MVRTPESFPRARLAAYYAVLFTALGLLLALRLHGVSAAVYSSIAAAFLHGRLDVASDLHDVAIFGGRAYYPLGPAPAAMVLPIVAVFGAGVPSVIVGVAALAAALPALWRLVVRQVGDKRRASWWLLATVAGSPLLLCASADNPYYAAHVLVAACLAWALVLALEGKAPLAAGFLVGLAAAARLDAAAALVPIALLYGFRSPGRASIVRWRAVGAVGLGLAPSLLLLAAYNTARFGSPLESGYALQGLDRPWLAALRSAGLFSPRHLPENLYYFLVAGPIFAPSPVGRLGFPWLVPSEWGMGLVWTSPWLLLAAAARGRRAAFIALGAIAVLLPSLFYYGIGWIQFGYRYGLDALPFMLLLALWGAERIAVRPRILLLLFLFALVVNAWGDLWMMGLWGLPRDVG